jgi:hypothetical protein
MDIDALIIELIESGRQATDEELSQIVAHVAQAPFASRLIRPPRWWREALARLGIMSQRESRPASSICSEGFTLTNNGHRTQLSKPT